MDSFNSPTREQCNPPLLTLCQVAGKAAVSNNGGTSSSRVVPSKPWEFTSVDYCGPLLTKPVAGRCRARSKTWIVIFVCHVTKGVHLDIVENLTTHEFIAALKRFGSRRGYPRVIYSDNAKTFVKAKSQLAELAKIFSSHKDHSILKTFLQYTVWSGNSVLLDLPFAMD